MNPALRARQAAPHPIESVKEGAAMRRWIVERKPVPLPPERISSLLVHRVGWVRSTLPAAGSGAWLDLKAHVEPGPGLTAWVVIVGAYPVARSMGGRPPDVGPLRAAARSRAREVLEELVAEVLTVLAPLPGIAPFGTGGTAAVPLLVRHIMDSDTPVIDEDLDAAAAATLLAAEETDGAPVVDRHGRLVGVLSERDLLGQLVRDLHSMPGERPTNVGALCTRPAIVTVPGLSAAHAAQQMLFHGVRRLIVVDQGHVVGMLTRRALLAALRSTVPSAATAATSERKTEAPDAVAISPGVTPVSRGLCVGDMPRPATGRPSPVGPAADLITTEEAADAG